ncbi:uncharacterized protein EV420DRAFT_1648487 [Desarmillaria tabescens]|uniref:PNPLA domain-containing protein n=1 Tax=Armillaria tabescens TaxID=1929756 RepID=A0AA39MSG6_ARMTA|nr:uncharacterized protein EV420DRAFT_1648487 [Desarmillaria tabescens]KAK0444962.1 hypothetical protein EV420DRAFT_1648487 [Desarmillaria tabescens]
MAWRRRDHNAPLSFKLLELDSQLDFLCREDVNVVVDVATTPKEPVASCVSGYRPDKDSQSSRPGSDYVPYNINEIEEVLTRCESQNCGTGAIIVVDFLNSCVCWAHFSFDVMNVFQKGKLEPSVRYIKPPMNISESYLVWHTPIRMHLAIHPLSKESRSSMANNTSNSSPVNLLSLDGGGIRGVSQLIILDEIMKRIQAKKQLTEVPKPCEYFHLMGGSGTGGLNAIMLAVVFSPDNRKPFYKDEKFKASTLKAEIKEIVKHSHGGYTGDESLLDPNAGKDSIGNVFVCAKTTANLESPQ